MTPLNAISLALLNTTGGHNPQALLDHLTRHGWKVVRAHGLDGDDECPTPKGCPYCAEFGCPRLPSTAETLRSAFVTGYRARMDDEHQAQTRRLEESMNLAAIAWGKSRFGGEG